MVLSDNDTKEFYEKFEWLRDILALMQTAFKEGDKQALISVESVTECNKTIDGITQIIYDDNEL